MMIGSVMSKLELALSLSVLRYLQHTLHTHYLDRYPHVCPGHWLASG